MPDMKIGDILAASKARKATASVSYNGKNRKITVVRYAVGPISTPYGKFMIYEFKLNDKWKEYEVIVSSHSFTQDLMPVFSTKESIYIKTDSGCRTGEIYLDNTCTCMQQLHAAMRIISSHGSGFLVTIPNQEGRGHGFARKYATLALQEYLGYDTYEAAKTVNRKVDIRDYYGVVAILKFFGITTDFKIILLANNKSKLKELNENGYKPKLKTLEIKADKHTLKHLKAKKEHLGEMVNA